MGHRPTSDEDFAVLILSEVEWRHCMLILEVTSQWLFMELIANTTSSGRGCSDAVTEWDWGILTVIHALTDRRIGHMGVERWRFNGMVSTFCTTRTF